MDLQTRKISFVQEFLNLQNEEIVSLLENLLKKEKNKIIEDELQPMTLDVFNERIDKSLEDSKEGRLTESDELIAEIKQWD